MVHTIERRDGELSSNVRQAVLADAFAHESAITPGLVISDIRIARVTIEYDVTSDSDNETHCDWAV
jgi:hypothetical protein